MGLSGQSGRPEKGFRLVYLEGWRGALWSLPQGTSACSTPVQSTHTSEEGRARSRNATRSVRAWAFATAWLLPIGLFAAEASDAETPTVKLEIYPAKVRLCGPEAQRLVILGVDAKGAKRDLTVEAKVESRSPARVRIGDDGSILPVADGTGEVVVRVGATEPRVPVEVARRPAAGGQLSQRGRAALDQAGLQPGGVPRRRSTARADSSCRCWASSPRPTTRRSSRVPRQRRVTPFAPEESLLLLKPTLAVAHGGGKRLEVGSAAYRLLTPGWKKGRRDRATRIRRSSGSKVYPDASGDGARPGAAAGRDGHAQRRLRARRDRRCPVRHA